MPNVGSAEIVSLYTVYCGFDTEFETPTDQTVWSRTEPTDKEFIWYKTHITYDDGSTLYSDPQLDDGTIRIIRIYTSYYGTEDADFVPNNDTPGWSETEPQNTYIWTRRVTEYSNSGVEYGPITRRENGESEDGGEGHGDTTDPEELDIISVENQYFGTDDPNKIPTSEDTWSTVTPENFRYLWVRTKTTYSDDSVVYSDPQLDISNDEWSDEGHDLPPADPVDEGSYEEPDSPDIDDEEDEALIDRGIPEEDDNYEKVQAAIIDYVEAQQEIFNKLTNNGTAEGIFFAEDEQGVKQLYINMSFARTGILQLGGSNNEYGVAQLLDRENNVISQWDQLGFMSSAVYIDGRDGLQSFINIPNNFSSMIAKVVAFNRDDTLYRYDNDLIHSYDLDSRYYELYVEQATERGWRFVSYNFVEPFDPDMYPSGSFANFVKKHASYSIHDRLLYIYKNFTSPIDLGPQAFNMTYKSPIDGGIDGTGKTLVIPYYIQIKNQVPTELVDDIHFIIRISFYSNDGTVINSKVNEEIRLADVNQWLKINIDTNIWEPFDWVKITVSGLKIGSAQAAFSNWYEFEDDFYLDFTRGITIDFAAPFIGVVDSSHPIDFGYSDQDKRFVLEKRKKYVGHVSLNDQGYIYRTEYNSNKDNYFNVKIGYSDEGSSEEDVSSYLETLDAFSYDIDDEIEIYSKSTNGIKIEKIYDNKIDTTILDDEKLTIETNEFKTRITNGQLYLEKNIYDETQEVPILLGTNTLNLKSDTLDLVYYDYTNDETGTVHIPDLGNISNKVSKDGDTMTGALSIQKAPFTIGTVPSSNKYGSEHWLLDQENNYIGSIESFYFTSDASGIQMQAERSDSGTRKTNVLRLGVNVDGTPYVQVTNQATWRKAIGFNSYAHTAGAGTFTLVEGGGGSTSSSGVIRRGGMALVTVCLKLDAKSYVNTGAGAFAKVTPLPTQAGRFNAVVGNEIKAFRYNTSGEIFFNSNTTITGNPYMLGQFCYVYTDSTTS